MSIPVYLEVELERIKGCGGLGCGWGEVMWKLKCIFNQEMRLFPIACDFLYVEEGQEPHVRVCVCAYMRFPRHYHIILPVTRIYPFLFSFHYGHMVSHCLFHRNPIWCPESTDKCSWHHALLVMLKVLFKVAEVMKFNVGRCRFVGFLNIFAGFIPFLF